jgi:hypothetical protein
MSDRCGYGGGIYFRRMNWGKHPIPPEEGSAFKSLPLILSYIYKWGEGEVKGRGWRDTGRVIFLEVCMASREGRPPKQSPLPPLLYSFH